jgi:hypothetical protein
MGFYEESDKKMKYKIKYYDKDTKKEYSTQIEAKSKIEAICRFNLTFDSCDIKEVIED